MKFLIHQQKRRGRNMSQLTLCLSPRGKEKLNFSQWCSKHSLKHLSAQLKEANEARNLELIPWCSGGVTRYFAGCLRFNWVLICFDHGPASKTCYSSTCLRLSYGFSGNQILWKFKWRYESAIEHCVLASPVSSCFKLKSLHSGNKQRKLVSVCI